MGPTILISIGVTLLALAAGTFLLARVNRENLGLLYKVIAWFIIVACALNLACAALQSMMRLYSRQYPMYDRKMYKKMMKRGMHPRMMHPYRADEANEACCNEGMCEAGEQWKKCYTNLKDSVDRAKVK